MTKVVAVRRGVYAAAVAGALAFGATQAMAAPAPPVETGAFCKDDLCETFCQAIGFLGGWCVNGECFCYID